MSRLWQSCVTGLCWPCKYGESQREKKLLQSSGISHQETQTKVCQALQAVRACETLAPFLGLSPKCQQEKIYPCIALNNLCARKYTYSMIVHPCKYFHSHSTVNWNMLYKLYSLYNKFCKICRTC